jgi:hypothetical protein
VVFLAHQEGALKHKKVFKKFISKGALRWKKHHQGEIKERNFGGTLGSV